VTGLNSAVTTPNRILVHCLWVHHDNMLSVGRLPPLRLRLGQKDAILTAPKCYAASEAENESQLPPLTAVTSYLAWIACPLVYIDPSGRLGSSTSTHEYGHATQARLSDSTDLASVVGEAFVTTALVTSSTDRRRSSSRLVTMRTWLAGQGQSANSSINLP
jgi:hypothetical protein